jgi:hypothetical protein
MTKLDLPAIKARCEAAPAVLADPGEGCCP